MEPPKWKLYSPLLQKEINYLTLFSALSHESPERCGANVKSKQWRFCGPIVQPSSSFCLQDQLRAAKGKIPRRSSLSAQQRDGGVLRPGSPAAFTPQRQCSPGQGLHHEARNQLPAHAQAAHHKYVSSGESSTTLYLY